MGDSGAWQGGHTIYNALLNVDPWGYDGGFRVVGGVGICCIMQSMWIDH